MSEAGAHGHVPHGATLERSKQELLQAARPLPSEGDVIMDDLTEDEDRLFLAAILDA
jgi:hypothetical protein